MPQRGLTAEKINRLQTIAKAALDGALGRTRLRAMGAEKALQSLQRLPGIGPFSAELIWVRGVGDPDWLPQHEPRLTSATQAAYQLATDPDTKTVSDLWRPYRAWVTLLLRQSLQDKTPQPRNRYQPDRRPTLQPTTDN